MTTRTDHPRQMAVQSEIAPRTSPKNGRPTFPLVLGAMRYTPRAWHPLDRLPRCDSGNTTDLASSPQFGLFVKHNFPRRDGFSLRTFTDYARSIWLFARAATMPDAACH